MVTFSRVLGLALAAGALAGAGGEPIAVQRERRSPPLKKAKALRLPRKRRRPWRRGPKRFAKLRPFKGSKAAKRATRRGGNPAQTRWGRD